MLSNKTEHSKFLALQKTVNAMPSYDDFKDLHDRVVPPVLIFDQTISDFTVEHKMFKDMILSMDRAIVLKATKASLIE